MANVSATIGANTQQAESSISRVLNGLRKLRQESATGAGMRLFASDEITKLSSALNQAIAAAGTLNKLDLSQFDASLRRSAELLQRNAQHYLRAQQALGQPGVAGRFAQQLGAGGNPLNPNFAQLFPGLQGAALQRQMDYYFRSLLRGTGLNYGAGGGRGGGTGHGGPTPGEAAGGGGAEGADAVNGMLLAAIKKLRPLAAAYLGYQGITRLTSSGLAAARGQSEAEDTLRRMTRERSGGVSLTDQFEPLGRRYGLSATETLKSAQVYAQAAQQVDRDRAATGLEAAAGYARAYGLNINQTAGTLGGLQRAGAVGNTVAAQNEFLLKLARTLKSTGMTANADEAIDDLAQTVDRYISHDLASPNQGKLDEFAALRAVTYTMPGLSGKHGQNLLSQYDDNLRSDQNDARNVMMAVALQRYGIDNPYTVRRIQAEGANFDLSAVPGSRAPQGMTYGQLAAEEAHRIAREAAQGRGTDFDRESMELDIQANLLNLPLPGAAVPYQIYQQRAQDRAKLVDAKAQLAQYGLRPEDFSNTSGIKDAVDLLDQSDTKEIRATAKRYAEGLDLTGEGGKAREDITKLLADANSDPEAIKRQTLTAMARFGQQGTSATINRTTQAAGDNALAATGRIFMDEWNKGLTVGAEALQGLATATDGTKDALYEFTAWLKQELTTGLPAALPGSVSQLPPGGPLSPTLLRGRYGGTLSAPWDTGAQAFPVAPRKSFWDTLLSPAEAKIGSSSLGGGLPHVGTSAPTTTAPAPAPATVAATLPDDVALDSPEWLAYLSSLDQQYGFPPGTMQGLAKTESGGLAGQKREYHYPADAQGRRESTASGIFGVLDSTATRPGYNTTPLPGPAYQQSPQRQADFAAQYLANRTKATGGNLGAGLAGYGTGTAAYAARVQQNSGTGAATPAAPVAPVTTAPPAATTSPSAATPEPDLSGLNIEDRSDPTWSYGKDATAKAEPFKGIVYHHTASDSLNNEVAYGKTHDAVRGGSFGYHYYIDRDGKIVQGAPLNKRTNHIKPGSKTGLSNKNAMGIALVGAKDGATPEQLAAARRLGTTVAVGSGIDPSNIYGHGELQSDRMATEGVAAAKQLRNDPALRAAVPSDTGAAAPTTVAASGKGGKTAVPGVDVPKLADVPSSVVTLTPEQQAAQAAKDAEAARQAQAAATPASRLEVSRRAAQQPKAEADSPAANPVQGDAAAVQRLNAGPTPPDGTDARSQGWVPHADTTATGAPKADAAKARELQGLPPVPDGTDARSQGWVPNPPAPGTQEVDADAQKTLSATANKDFGTLAVNVNHYQNGVKQRTESQTLRAGSGGADNTVKGAVNISPEATA